MSLDPKTSLNMAAALSASSDLVTFLRLHSEIALSNPNAFMEQRGGDKIADIDDRVLNAAEALKRLRGSRVVDALNEHPEMIASFTEAVLDVHLAARHRVNLVEAVPVRLGYKVLEDLREEGLVLEGGV